MKFEVQKLRLLKFLSSQKWSPTIW